jgi:hypothetical protein
MTAYSYHPKKKPPPPTEGVRASVAGSGQRLVVKALPELIPARLAVVA